MIARIWHGRTRSENADDYLDFLLAEGTREYLDCEGNRSVRVWRKRDHESCEFWTVTEWKDADSVKSFAGDDYEKAKYYPRDNDMLLEFEGKATHCECFDVSASKTRDYVRQLEQLYHGGSWQSECFVDKLKNVDEAKAFLEPCPGVHSIAEIVWHCIYWRGVLIKRLEGDHTYRDETVERQNFLTASELKEVGWEGLKQKLEETQNFLLDYLRSRNDSHLSKEYAQGYTFDFHFEGIIQHDIYHLGQIGLVKKIPGAAVPGD